MHTQADKWLQLVSQQQDLAQQIRQLIDTQHDLARQWQVAGASDIASAARSIEQQLRVSSSALLQLEHTAVDKIAHAVGSPERHPRSGHTA